MAGAIGAAAGASTSNGGAGTAGTSAGPLWTFHGTADTEVPIAADNSGRARFAACPQPRQEALHTTYPGAGHADSWTMTYNLSAGHDI